MAQRRRPPLADLARAVQGPVLTPGSAAYTAARQVVNARYSGARPLAVLRARSVSDVRQAVLVDVKTTYDPDEVFRFRQGIRPR